ncbi:hypothetical protein SBOR_8444 [Sclerotinia borealis F-4128]|uniref:Uncharacterized protein n=1 Tax=Sclerotinia borealis (strain F-4128) TaxID=1432307 RepID=W9C9B7_SCLBF|nr:hypothetical protein SBOR_8444 [Sclerotinia borealis F-4128]
MDFSDGMTDLDIHNVNDKRLRDSQNDPVLWAAIKKIRDHAIKVMEDFDRFLNTKITDPWELPGEKTFKYWENLKPTLGLLCLFDDSPNGKFERSQDISPPRLCWVVIDADLSCHMDGAPLHKYKGLAQMFDGAPW